jgi:hypothetical protein
MLSRKSLLIFVLAVFFIGLSSVSFAQTSLSVGGNIEILAETGIWGNASDGDTAFAIGLTGYGSLINFTLSGSIDLSDNVYASGNLRFRRYNLNVSDASETIYIYGFSVTWANAFGDGIDLTLEQTGYPTQYTTRSFSGEQYHIVTISALMDTISFDFSFGLVGEALYFTRAVNPGMSLAESSQAYVAIIQFGVDVEPITIDLVLNYKFYNTLDWDVSQYSAYDYTADADLNGNGTVELLISSDGTVINEADWMQFIDDEEDLIAALDDLGYSSVYTVVDGQRGLNQSGILRARLDVGFSMEGLLDVNLFEIISLGLSMGTFATDTLLQIDITAVENLTASIWAGLRAQSKSEVTLYGMTFADEAANVTSFPVGLGVYYDVTGGIAMTVYLQAEANLEQILEDGNTGNWGIKVGLDLYILENQTLTVPIFILITNDDYYGCDWDIVPNLSYGNLLYWNKASVSVNTYIWLSFGLSAGF